MADDKAITWTKVGNRAGDLLRELTALYWEALETEITNAIYSLNHVLRLRSEHPEAEIGPASLGQRMSARLEAPMQAWAPLNLNWQDQSACHGAAQQTLLEMQNVDDEYLLARMFLSGLGMLDIDEIVEYREATLPSQNGPPEFETTIDEQGNASIISITCDNCDRPIRETSWKCKLGCEPPAQDSGIPLNPFRICMSCYTAGLHPKHHMVPMPHRYAIPADVQAVLTPTEFWRLRRGVQHHQDDLDLAEDRKTVGIIWNAITRKLSSWARSDKRFPLGNIHAGLTYGPLVFETGVSRSRGGVRISCRQSLNLGRQWSKSTQSTILAIDPHRHLYKTTRPLEHQPVQAAIKQVVGGAFSGYHPHLRALEDLVIKMFFKAAEKWREQPLKSRRANEKGLRQYAKTIVGVIKLGMDDHVQHYLKTLTDTLFDAKTNLCWEKYENNCQNFCDVLLTGDAFAHVFPSKDNLRSLRIKGDPCSDYVISFRTDPGLGEAVQSTGISIGPMTAFLKQVHRPTNVLLYQESQGRRNSPETPLCARVFAWHCQSEDCDLADHVWTNPAELVSVLQFHLLSERNDYKAASADPEAEESPMTDIEWTRARLAVLQALDSFQTSAASISMAFQDRLKSEPSQMWEPPRPPSIPQSLPFQYDGDEIHMQQEDPGSGPRGWFPGHDSSSNKPQIELPAEYTLLGERAVAIMSTIGTALNQEGGENKSNSQPTLI